MSEEGKKEKISYYENFYPNAMTKEEKIQESSDSQKPTSENSNEDGCSDHIERPQEEKSYETQIIKVLDQPTKTLEIDSSIPLSIFFQILNEQCFKALSNQANAERLKEEAKLIGNKRSSTNDDVLKKEDISQTQAELNMDIDKYEILIDIITQIIYNWKEFFNELSLLPAYNCELNLTLEENFKMSIKKIFDKDILKKNLEELILLKEEKEPEKEKFIKNELEKILKTEEKSNNLKFFKMLKIELKDLLLIYIFNRVIRFNKCQLKTLKDNIKYNEKEKEKIKSIILSYIKSLKEKSPNNSCNELVIPIPPLNLTPLSKDDVLENDNINAIASMKKNENENKNIIKIKDNQEKNEEQRYSNLKTNDITDEETPKELEALICSTINKIYKFVVEEIKKLLAKIKINGKNKKIKKVSIYKYLTGNSTEIYRAIFYEKICCILKKENENEQVIEDILKDTNNLDNLKALKELLNMEFLDIIKQFIKDEILNLSNGTKIKINIFFEEKTKKQKEVNDRIKKNVEKIKQKIKDIIECKKERMREKNQTKDINVC